MLTAYPRCAKLTLENRGEKNKSRLNVIHSRKGNVGSCSHYYYHCSTCQQMKARQRSESSEKQNKNDECFLERKTFASFFPSLALPSLTYGGAVEQHLLQAAAVVVECEVPRPRVHVLDEAGLLEAAQQEAFGGFGP